MTISAPVNNSNPTAAPSKTSAPKKAASLLASAALSPLKLARSIVTLALKIIFAVFACAGFIVAGALGSVALGLAALGLIGAIFIILALAPKKAALLAKTLDSNNQSNINSTTEEQEQVNSSNDVNIV